MMERALEPNSNPTALLPFTRVVQLTTDDKLALLEQRAPKVSPAACTQNLEQARIQLHAAVDRALNNPAVNPRPVIHSAIDNILNHALLQMVLAPEAHPQTVEKAWGKHQTWPSDAQEPHNLETLTGNPGMEEALSHLVVVATPVLEPKTTKMYPRQEYIRRKTRSQRDCVPRPSSLRGRGPESPIRSAAPTRKDAIQLSYKQGWQKSSANAPNTELRTLEDMIEHLFVTRPSQAPADQSE